MLTFHFLHSNRNSTPAARDFHKVYCGVCICKCSRSPSARRLLGRDRCDSVNLIRCSSVGADMNNSPRSGCKRQTDSWLVLDVSLQVVTLTFGAKTSFFQRLFASHAHCDGTAPSVDAARGAAQIRVFTCGLTLRWNRAN